VNGVTVVLRAVMGYNIHTGQFTSLVHPNDNWYLDGTLIHDQYAKDTLERYTLNASPPSTISSSSTETVTSIESTTTNSTTTTENTSTPTLTVEEVANAITKKCIVVAPKSVLGNWEKEWQAYIEWPSDKPLVLWSNIKKGELTC